MSRTRLNKMSQHSINRALERCGIKGNGNITLMTNNAIVKGQNPVEFPKDSELGKFLRSKEHGKRVKVYKGKVFIINKNSNRLITLYPIPEEYIEEYKRYQKVNNENISINNNKKRRGGE
jgi:hypothetical protein